MTATQPKPPGYVLNLDLARGVLAVLVMVYHGLSGESLGEIERIAYYAVYGFFVISGASLYITYADRLRDGRSLRAFFVRRWYRIAPLFVVALCVRLALLPWPADAWLLILLNVTLLFSFAHPGATSLVGGGWSIGIEVVFYVVFPVIVLTMEGRWRRLAVLAAAGFIVMLAYGWYVLRDGTTMTNELWKSYTQPIAFFGYFAAGCLMGELHLRGLWPQWLRRAAIPLAVLALVPFLLIRVEQPIHLLLGWKGFLLAAGTIALIAASMLARQVTGGLAVLAERMGALSYSLYLLHGLVHSALTRLDLGLGKWGTFSAMVVLSFVAAWLTSRYVEFPARRWGRERSSAIGASA